MITLQNSYFIDPEYVRPIYRYHGHMIIRLV